MLGHLNSVGNTVLAVAFILGSSILVHEVGHFVTARLAGMKVEEFLIGFPPRLWSFVRGGTRYGIGAVIFGGFVRIAGMEPGQETVEGGFYTKPRISQIFVLVSGSLMNIILGIALFAVIGLVWGTEPLEPPTVRRLTGGYHAARDAGVRRGDVILALDGHRKSLEIAAVRPGSPAARLGLAAGDVITALDDDMVAVPEELIERVRNANRPLEMWVEPPKGEARSVKVTAAQLGVAGPPKPGESAEKLLGVTCEPLKTFTAVFYIASRPGQRVLLTIQRGDTTLDVGVVPEKKQEQKQVKDESGKSRLVPLTIGRIGVAFQTRPSPPGKAIKDGFRNSTAIIVGIVEMFAKAIRGQAPLEVGGPVAIVATAAEQAQVGFNAVLQLCAIISVNLAFINLLPIPITDGGRMALVAYEAIIRRRVSRQREMAWLLTGLAVIVVLFLAITFKDVFYLVRHH
jgi:regulator of sigma E protease